ncbi:hypothetical protein Hamer_G027016, partial [Homarus americanus]
MQRQRHGRRLRRIVGDRMNPFTAMSDAEFVDRFRLRKESVNSIIQEIQDQLPVANDKRGKAKFHVTDGTGCHVPPNLQVLIAIRCMATGSHQIAIGDCYDVSSLCHSEVEGLGCKFGSCNNKSSPLLEARSGTGFVKHKSCPGFVEGMLSAK